LFNSFGVNIAVVTNDEKLVLVKRGEDVLKPNVFNSTVNEGLSRDLDKELNRTVSVYNVGIRGLWEEMGVGADEIEDYKLTSVGFDIRECQYGALGYARLRVTLDDLQKRLVLSKDASFEIGSFETTNETGEKAVHFAIHGIQNSPRALAAFLERKEITITSAGLVCYLLSFLSTGYDIDDLEKAFREPHWRDNSFIV